MSKQCLNKLFFCSCLLLAGLFLQSAAYAKHLLVFGDSLSAAYGMDLEQGWAHLLSEHWANGDGPKIEVSNASISGETTTGGLARLPITLEEIQPDVVFLELGANDGLQGHPVDRIKENLLGMVDLIERTGAKAVIAGISLPPSYGPRYIDQFRQVFRDVAAIRQLPYIDLYREDFLSKPGYIQEDGLHPTEITQPIIRDSLLDFFAEHRIFE